MIKKIVILSLLAFVQIKSAQSFFSIQFMCYADKAKCIKYKLENVKIEVSDKLNGIIQGHYFIKNKSRLWSHGNEFSISNPEDFAVFGVKGDLSSISLYEELFVKFDKEIKFENLNTDMFNWNFICLYNESKKLIAKFKIQMGKKHTIFLDQFESEIKALSIDYN